MTEWKFENIKGTPLGHPTADVEARYRQMGYEADDFYEYFPCFLGAKGISRYLSFVDCYKQTIGIAGHMAEVGVYRGAVSLLLAKLSLLYEPHSLTQVHGFDFFERGNPPSGPKGYSFIETYARVKELIDIQGLGGHVLLHQLNVITELKGFFEQNPHLRFKLVFLDAGTYPIVASCLREFWPRLTPGGIVVFDQYNHEAAPGETLAVTEYLPPGTVIRTFPHGWMPSAYVVKT